ncbi:LuxR family transcriptional regulator [Streptomyces vastus]|uniref:helix-turn-helix transcriptional regulator n=1 Tax=Streptomyces vastus TaxID=285451 RepID=UPI0031D0855B
MEPGQRTGELGRLTEILANCAAGSGRAALITGVPGVGKTRLLRAVCRVAEGEGAAVLDATATRAERDLPLGVVGQLLSCADLRPPDPRDALAEVRRIVRRLAESATVVVAVDDVRHTDTESARCLLHLLGRIASARVLVLLAGHLPARPLPAPPVLELVRHPRCARFTLDRWSEQEVAGFLAELSGGAARFAPAWHRAGGGNPRLLQALAEDTHAHRPGSGCGPEEPVAGPAFRQAVSECLRQVDPDTAAVARAAAALGPDMRAERIARLLDSTERSVALALDALTEMGLLASGRFRHEAAPAALLDEIPSAECAALHARCARLLYDDGAPSSAVARQLMAAAPLRPAGPGPVPWAVSVLKPAAEEARCAGDAESAVAALRLARRLCADEAERAGLLVALTRAEAELDPAVASRRLPSLVSALHQGLLDVQDAAVPIAQLLWHGRPEEARDALTALSARTTQHRTHSPLARLWHRLARLYPELPGSECAGTPGRLLGEPPDQDPAEDPCRAAERVLQRLAVSAPVPVAPVCAALIDLTHAGEPDRAALWCERLAPALRSATPVRRALFAATAAVVHCRLGDHAAAAERARTALALLPDRGWGIGIGLPLHAAVLAATEQGEHTTAAELLRRPVPKEMFRTPAALYYLFARGRHHLAQRRHHAALADFRACRDLMERWRLDWSEALPWRTYADEARRATGGAAEPREPLAGLSEAERRVAVLAAEGHTNRAIAARLFVTASTVEQHLTRVYRKLGLRSRAQLAGLLDTVTADGA